MLSDCELALIEIRGRLSNKVFRVQYIDGNRKDELKSIVLTPLINAREVTTNTMVLTIDDRSLKPS